MGMEDKVRKRIGIDAAKQVGCGDFDAYKTLGAIGTGGSGIVWKVSIGGEYYAMKTPGTANTFISDSHMTLPPDKDAQDQFYNEALNWSKLTDKVPDAVVRLMDFNVEPFPWMIMELADGDLNSALTENTFNVEMFLKLLAKLQSIHGQGVIHRDIKPENILSVNGEWKFSDFGLSKLDSKKTTTDEIKGSPLYMAPEQIDHIAYGHTDLTTDLWQMGILFYRVVVGKNPYHGADENLFAFIKAICESGPDLTDVPKQWCPVFQTVFQKDHSRRFQSASEFADAVKNIIDNKTPSTSEQLFELGIKYYQEGNYPSDEQAFQYFMKASEMKHPAAQRYLGMMYEEGRGVQKSYSDAIVWYKKAAKQGDAVGQYRLGLMYEIGNGVEQSDYSQAAKWYKKAAEQGNPEGQYRLGYMYEEGWGVGQSDRRAVEWYKKASEQGNADASYSMGKICRYRPELSNLEYTDWFRKAAEQGNADASLKLAQAYSIKAVLQHQSPSEAFKWFMKAAELGNAEAQGIVGSFYAIGKVVEKSDSEAFKWFSKAAEQGDPEGQYRLGRMYEEGWGVGQSDSKAVDFYKKAAEKKNARAQYNLGRMYEQGKGVQQSYVEAIKWYTKAANNRNSDAQYGLGRMYEQGKGVQQSYVEAIKWYTKAADYILGASYRLGKMYEDGIGVEQSYSEAIKWYKKGHYYDDVTRIQVQNHV